MQPDKKKYHIILSLLLLHFVVYAISPLSRIGPVSFPDGQTYIEQRKAVSLKNVGIVLLNIFSPNASDREDADDSTSRLILFKKIKAVVQSLTDTKDKLIIIAENSEHPLAYGSVPSITRGARGGIPKPYDNFLAVFSGLSPPPVQSFFV